MEKTVLSSVVFIYRMNKSNHLIRNQNLHANHLVDEYFFQGFDSLCIFHRVETEPICFDVKLDCVCAIKKSRRVDINGKTGMLSINFSRIICLNSNYSSIVGGAGNIK